MKALIFGISGQDGAYLARLLLDKGYEVIGTSRNAVEDGFSSLRHLGIRDRLRIVALAPTDADGVRHMLQQVEPDEIYYLAGQSSVGLSFEQPLETHRSIAVGTLTLFDALRSLKRPPRVFNACSGDCFGGTGEHTADESTTFAPTSPYAVAKAAAFWSVANARAAYGIHACSGILFNHESPLRPTRFVTRKIVSAACNIAHGAHEPLRLGNLSIIRDWGWAPDYVEAMWRMLQTPQAADYVIATGRSHTLSEFVAATFTELGLNWKEWVVSDPALMRPGDPQALRANPARAKVELDWSAECDMFGVVRRMVSAEMDRRISAP